MYGLTPYRPARREIEYNPFRQMEEFEKRFFSEPFTGFFKSGEIAEFKTDISEKDDCYLLEADLPGFKKEDISLDLDGNRLTIRATREDKSEEQDEAGRYICRERSFGSYSRSFDVSAVDTEAITAKLEEGVLKLTMPKKQPKTPASRKLVIE